MLRYEDKGEGKDVSKKRCKGVRWGEKSFEVRRIVGSRRGGVIGAMRGRSVCLCTVVCFSTPEAAKRRGHVMIDRKKGKRGSRRSFNPKDRSG